MEKLIIYKKQIITTIIIIVISVICFGVYILHTTLNNINYSKSEAHVVALKQFPGTIVSSQIEYEQILDQVWGYDEDVSTNVVEVYIRYLRNKIPGIKIETVRGVGYRLS